MTLYTALHAWFRKWKRRRMLRARREALPDPFKN